MNVIVRRGEKNDVKYVNEIVALIEKESQVIGAGFAVRTPEYIEDKIMQGHSVIALDAVTGDLAGFIYLETWQHNKYVANSGLVVEEKYRGKGIGRRLKEKAFELTRKLFPEAKIFDLTTSLAVIKINSRLGYEPVDYSQLTTDDDFWMECETCMYYDVLVRTKRTNCLCEAMLFDPAKKKNKFLFFR